MTAALQIGDQLILEEDYDDSYIPSEQEIQEYAREIGINPENESELMWLAREGIVAPLPAEWKPCQDVTGDVYYFNFATGQSTWDHPCDEHYRTLVNQERERLQVQNAAKKKDKKRKKEKKEKKEKRDQLKPPLALSSPLAPVQSLGLPQAPLGGLAPLRGLVDSSGSTLRGSLGSTASSSGGLELATTQLGSSGTIGGLRAGGLSAGLLGMKHEERVSLTLPGLEEDQEDESQNESPRGTARLMRNLHMDVGSLGGGFEYEKEDSLRESQIEGRDKTPLDSGSHGACPPTPHRTGLGKETDLDSDLSEGEPKAKSETAGQEVESDPNHNHGAENAKMKFKQRRGVLSKGAAILISDEEEKEDKENHSSSTDGTGRQSRLAMGGEAVGDKEKDIIKMKDGIRERGTEESNRSGRDLDLSDQPLKESEPSEQIKELHLSGPLEDLSNKDKEFGFRSRVSEQVMDVEALLPALESLKSEPCKSGAEKTVEKVSLEEERTKRAEAAESEEEDLTLSSEEQGNKEASRLERFEREDVEASKKDGRTADVSASQAQLAPPAEERIRQKETLKRPSQESLEESQREADTKLEQERSRIRREEEERILKLREELRREEEEKARELHQEKENKLRSLKEQLRIEIEEQEETLKEEHQDRLERFRVQTRSEKEVEEEKIRTETEAILQQLRDKLEGLQLSEKKGLEEKKQLLLESMKRELAECLNEEKSKLEKEKENALLEMRARLEGERREALEALEKRQALELKELKSTAEEKHQKLVSSLQKQITEVQSSEEVQLQGDLRRAQQKVQQAADYERELGDLLKEKRKEVEKEHGQKMEKMKEEHQQTLERIRDDYEEEERKLREKLLRSLKEECERLTGAHEREITGLRRDLEQRLSELQQNHRDKETKLQDLENQLELRSREIKAKAAQFKSQEELIRKQRQQLHDEEEQLTKERAEAPSARLCKQELEESRLELHSVKGSIRQSRGDLEQLQQRKAELESEVETLQNKIETLQSRVSELEAGVQKREEAIKETLVSNDVSLAGEEVEGALCVEDLRKSLKTAQKVGSSSRTEEEEDVSIDDLRHYISAEGASIKKAKEFLTRQTRSLRKRQAALKAAKRQWCHDLLKVEGEVQGPESSLILEDARKSLDQESKHLDEMKSAMRKGQVLLRKKEEKLNQLESSLLEELSDEDTLKGTGYKKVVTFDLSDSDDLSSIISTDLPALKMDLKPVLTLPHPSKVQYLSDSLQRITSDLNTVLSVLGSLGKQQSPLFTSTQFLAPSPPSEGVPLSAYTSLTRTPATGSCNSIPLPKQWAWSTGANPNLSASTAQSVDDILTEKWSKYFPGGIQSLSANPAPLNGRPGYISASEQIRLLQRSQLRVPETDRNAIQGMIDANKKWLDSFKKDPKVPLFTKTNKTPSNHGILQLGLDENNQIKVYHY
ncbi:centrosomal protein of 164 kDa isoform X2 [Latimeria chalumnae]|uniref:centrosomal protein of 164 kDa isoform X2 n=1 Tax=Latimeria chalumnae TaxID=7897 RepID=UPI00313DC10D